MRKKEQMARIASDIDFLTKTSAELRSLIAAGFLPPIAGADDGTVPDAAQDAAQDAATEASMEQVFERHAAAEQEQQEAPQQQQAEASEEAPDEGGEEGIDFEQYNLALAIAADPDDEQYDIAVEILQEYAPPEVLAAYGLDGDPSQDSGELTEDQQIAEALGEDATGIPQVDRALYEFRLGQQQQQSAEQAAAEAAAEQAFDADFAAIAGDDAPTNFDEMNPEQRLIASALYGADSVEGLGDPKEFVEAAMKEYKDSVREEIIREYTEGKGDFTLPPATGRNASSTKKLPETPAEGKAALASLYEKHATAGTGVSG